MNALFALLTLATPPSPSVDGIVAITSPGIPGALAITRGTAVPLVVGKEGKFYASAAAAASFGKGRIVAWGHDGYFSADSLTGVGTAELMSRSVEWAANGRKDRIYVPGSEAMAAFLERRGFQVIRGDRMMPKEPVNAVVLTHSQVPNDDLSPMRESVRRGTGLVFASTGWGWQMITGKAISQHPFNAAFRDSGIAYTDAMLDDTAADGFLVGPVDPQVSGAEALRSLGSGEMTGQGSASTLLALRSGMPASDPFRRELSRDLRGVDLRRLTWPIPQSDVKARLAVAVETLRAESEAKASPLADRFPGVPKDRTATTRRVALEGVPGAWISTGVQALPGVPITLRSPKGTDFDVRIGSHTDLLWHHDAWQRAPSVSRLYRAGGPVTQVTSALGGLVYLVPKAGTKATVVIEGGVAAPLFRKGRTSKEEWLAQRALPGTWAEIAGDKVVITVPSSDIRRLEDAQAIAEFWDEVADVCADLAGAPLPRTSPERMVADIQISAGYMHSGYPIMTHLDAAPLAVDLGKLKTVGSWGHFHELGHNHQSDLWTFEGTGEVTVNLFSMRVYQQLLGRPTLTGHPAIDDRAALKKRVVEFVRAGSDHSKWQSDPFLALAMYMDLIEAFGWEPFRKVFRAYRELPETDRPQTEQQKRDRWLVMMSRQVGRDLGPFFLTWGVPTTALARAEVENLPDWMPDYLKGVAR